ncbi:MAG TPA: DMT family transporter, partial [Chitinophagaceae bacterium]
TGGPLVSALLSFFTGFVCLLILNLLLNRGALFGMKPLAVTPWYTWLGGLIGAIFVTCVIWVSQQQGMALTFALVVTGQIFISLLIDQFGLFGSIAQPMTIQKILGALLIVTGLLLIKL